MYRNSEDMTVTRLSRYTFYFNGRKELKISNLVFDLTLLLIVFIALMMFAMPHYTVWSQRMAGEAALAKASQDRQIKVQEAIATKDSAGMLADAEAIRAEGVARANHIIGDSLKGNEDYLRYLWIDSLDKTKGQVIYIPTEGNLPVLESQRLNQVSK